jgi:hypothetical protein
MPAESIFGTGCPPLVWVLRIRPCGDCLTYSPGHYKTWDHWRRDRTVEPALRAIVQSSETKNAWVLRANGRVAYYCTAAYTRLSRLRGRRAGAGKFQGAAARQGVPVPLNRVRAVGDARLIAGRGGDAVQGRTARARRHPRRDARAVRLQNTAARARARGERPGF